MLAEGVRGGYGPVAGLDGSMRFGQVFADDDVDVGRGGRCGFLLDLQAHGWLLGKWCGPASFASAAWSHRKLNQRR